MYFNKICKLNFIFAVGYESHSSNIGNLTTETQFSSPPISDSNSVFPFSSNLAVMHSKLFQTESQQQLQQQQQHFASGLTDISKSISTGIAWFLIESDKTSESS